MRSPTRSYLGIQFIILLLIAIYVIATLGLVIIGLARADFAVCVLALVQFVAGVVFVIYSNREY